MIIVKKVFIFLMILVIASCATSNDNLREAAKACSDLRKSEDYVRAISCYNEIAKTYPNDPRGYAGRGSVFLDQENFDRAIDEFTKAIDKHPNNDTVNASLYYLRGLAKFHTKKFDLAIADFDQAIKFNPKHGNAFAFRSISYVEKNNYKQALSDANEAAMLSPNDKEIQELLADLKTRVTQTKE
jgi:tetratricopeptide (TPR) repeat protein